MSARKTLALSALTLSLLATPALADAGVEVGRLTCNAVSGTNFIIGSTKTLDCQFKTLSGKVEPYRAEISRFGIDIGKVKKMTIVWGVVAPSKTLKPGSLAGDYAGISADLSIGAGAGANALVGGLENSITLQPLSVQSQTGTNIAAGVAGMKLKAM